MFWKKISLDGFIPFTHTGTKHVEIEFTKPCCAILGGNGTGKSSLLREMCVAPSQRPNYLKDGKIEKILSHNNHVYTLTSDFSNATAPHSFKLDGTELNLSGTSDTQKDLVEEHFGLSTLTDDILAGNIHICSMQKSQRKQLFSSTYPGDLSFVLEYFKKVGSQVRAFGNQIKLLQGREGSLIASLIDETERTRMTKWRESVNEIINRIDKINLLLENEINQLLSNEDFKLVSQDKSNYDLSHLHQELENCLHTFRISLSDWNQSSKLGEVVTQDILKSKRDRISQEVEYLKDKQKTILTNVQKTRDELNKFINLRDAPKQDHKEELSKELELTLRDMEDLRSSSDWQDAPAIQSDRLEEVEKLVPWFIDAISSIHPYAGRLIGQERITEIHRLNDSLTFENTSLIHEQTTLEHQLHQQKSRKEMMTQNSYPKDCSRVCGLRATLEASVRDIDLHITDIESRLKLIADKLQSNANMLDVNKRELVDISPALPLMKRLWDKLSENYLIDLVLNGESYLDCLNNHCADITNRIVSGIKSSKIYFRYKKLFERSESIKHTITMMESNEAANLSLEVIQNIVKDKEVQLNEGITQLEDLESKCYELEHSLEYVSNVKGTVDSITNLIKKINIAANAALVENRLEFDRQIIAEHVVIRNELNSKLRETEHVLNEQKRIIDVLDTEIRPTLSDLRQQKRKWEVVEKSLNPTSGLPCIYLVRFINRLISRVNAFIKEIWFCDMELAYIEEKENFDFTLSVILNKSTTVKDISLCSKGQAAIIDLAMTLAICMERGWLNLYPLKFDEIDAALTDEHRTKLVDVISRLLDNGTIKQLFLVNHFAIQSGIANCQIVALNTDGIVLPNSYNETAIIE